MIKKSLVSGDKPIESRVIKKEHAPSEERLKSCFSKKTGGGQDSQVQHHNFEDYHHTSQPREKLPSNKQVIEQPPKTEYREDNDDQEYCIGRSIGERITTSPEGDDCVKEIS
jgi:hypothetical protein